MELEASTQILSFLPELIEFCKQGKPLAFAVASVAMLVKLSKTTTVFDRIPERYRVPFISLLGILAGALPTINGNIPINEGLLAALSGPLAMWVHDLYSYTVKGKHRKPGEDEMREKALADAQKIMKKFMASDDAGKARLAKLQQEQVAIEKPIAKKKPQSSSSRPASRSRRK